jgi:hypothetical protein
MPGLAFPPVGRLGLASPPSPVLCSATTATRPSRWPLLPLGHRYLVCSFCSCPRLRSGSLPLRNPCVNARPAWSPGTPFPGCRQGNKWLSQVPRLPLCQHAPLFDPGGVLNTRLIALRTAAFRLHDSVSFPAIQLTVILLSTTIQISGLNHAACFLAPPGFGLPLPALPAGFATDPLARLWSGGTYTHWVTLTNFYRLTPISHRSGLLLARHALVRRVLGVTPIIRLMQTRKPVFE